MAAQLWYLGFPVAFTPAGYVAPGAKAYFYLPGTLTLTDVYSEATLTTERANPVVANAAGRFPDTYLDESLTYRVRITDALGVLLDETDPYTPGEIVAGARGAPGPAGTIEISGIEFVTPQQFGAEADGATDDTAAIQGAIDAVEAAGGPRVIYFPTPAAGGFYKCDGQLDLTDTTGIAMRGEGNRVEPTQDLAPCALVYTGTAAAFILAGGSHGLTIDGLGIQNSNAAFTGDLVTLDETGGSGETTYSTSLTNCQFGGRTSAARFARACVNAGGAVELFIDLCTFGYADHHIVARFNAGIRPWSNAVYITRNRFVEHNNHAINIWGAKQWSIVHNVFEYSYGTSGTGGNAAGITDLLVGDASARNSSGVRIEGNGFWDAAAGTWIDILASGQVIDSNWTDLIDGATFIKFHSGTGVKVSGNRVEGTAGSIFITNVLGTVASFGDDGTNLVDGPVTYNGNPATFTLTNRSFQDVVTRNLDATAVSGVGGAVHARKAVGVDLVGGAVIVDRNDDTNWRGAALFSIYDSTLAKDCLALAVSSSTTAPNTVGKIRALLTEDGDFKPVRKLLLDATMTAGGTTGAQTINKASGSVNFAAAAASLVVTNSLVSTSSIIICTVMTNDTTMKSVQAVSAAGSFTLYANAAATAETKVGFAVVN